MRRPDLVLAGALTVVVAGAIALWLGRSQTAPAALPTAIVASAPAAAATDNAAAAAPETSATDAAQAAVARNEKPDPTSTRAVDAADVTRRRWPVAWKATSATKARGTATEPSVRAELAFEALRLVGVDPAAEQTWERAIHDRSLPDGVRSDLIEDLNDEGYTDNDRPGQADLPLILARMQILERLMPNAQDAVEAAAMAEAYKDLLEMYEKLGGQGAGR
jgi:hypothetical protein